MLIEKHKNTPLKIVPPGAKGYLRPADLSFKNPFKINYLDIPAGNP
jgi:hypothetical protein